jgi:hypothetical protein
VRALWILIAVLVAGAMTLAMMPRSESEPASAGSPISIPRGAGGAASALASPASRPPATATSASEVANAQPNQAPTAVTGASEAAAGPKPAVTGAPRPAPGPPTSRGGLSELGMERTIPTATVGRGELVRRPDGSILADGKWPIGGDGSAERPYEVTWDLLLSAKETYQPRLGEFVIPQRVALLDGAHVRISGYVAFPIVSSEADECLLMLNQWDGCCIGVPPSPYDGIEAKLVRSQDNSRKHLFLYGTLTGVFHVDPFVQGKWLVGLYTMTGADLVTDL